MSEQSESVIVDLDSVLVRTAVELAKRHPPRPGIDGEPWCVRCWSPWPCVAAADAREVCRAAGLEQFNGPEPTPLRAPAPTPHRSPEPTPHRYPEPAPRADRHIPTNRSIDPGRPRHRHRDRSTPLRLPNGVPCETSVGQYYQRVYPPAVSRRT